ncbi:REP-associated tyrosine transposase [Nitrosomonas communis]|uniref:Putative transposase n=1 Tax=Nitrosomonas communis TaxID=44574 RepID=A0A1I4T8H5_9PROT|nr:transposase [Nitrosomonas communis]SFM73088.1 putative transposase [Nitrosomonas communis]
MSNYRCNRIPGGTYFFTVNLYDRKSDLLITHIDALCAAVRIVKQQRPFHIDAWVILRDHLHCIWALPAHDDDYSSRWQIIKKVFSKFIPKTEYRSETHIIRNERGIWQRCFWEHTIYR